MGYERRLNQALASALHLPLSDCSKYVLISDCHRGVGNSNDNFMKNQHLYFAAMQYYQKKGFSYLELGDGEELWENKRLSLIKECHSDVYWMFDQLEKEKKIWRIYGNHDMVRKKELQESICLVDDRRGIRVLLLHGHQADFWNSTGWRMTRFLVRFLWRPLERIGVKDPTGSARNYKSMDQTERRLVHWAREKEIMVICGHTHRPRLKPEEFVRGWGHGILINTGCCVHPRCITAVEIEGYQMRLVKWWMTTREDMTVCVERVILEETAQEPFMQKNSSL